MKKSQWQNVLSKAGRNSLLQDKIFEEREQILGQPYVKKKFRKCPQANQKETILEAIIKSAKPSRISLTSIKSQERPKREPESEINSPVSFDPEKNYLPSFSFRDLCNLNYSTQDKHIPTVKFKTITTIKRKAPERTVKIHNHSEQSIKKSGSEHSNIGVCFNKQLARDFDWMQKNLSDKRFDYLPNSPLGKTGPCFDKQISRDDLYKTKEIFPDYQYDKEKILKKIAKNIHFDKYLKREAMSERKSLPECYDVKFSYVDPKPRICRFA